jgi:hypothetical protein
MNLTISPQIRIVALVGLLAIVALGGSMMVLGRSHSTNVPAAGQRHGSATPRHGSATPRAGASPARSKTQPKAAVKTATPAATARKATPAQSAATPKPAVTHKAATTHKATTTHKAAAKHRAATKHAAAKFRGNPVYADLPQPLQWQLAHHKVVVVSFYNPNADVDAISVAEAHAGATQAGAGFLLVSVLDNSVAGILTGLLPSGGLLPEPGVLIYRAPGSIAFRVDGFLDRDSVAQAAANALAAPVVPTTAATPATTTVPGTVTP